MKSWSVLTSVFLLILASAAPADARQSPGDERVIVLALNQQCVDPSVAAQRENLDKPICTGPPPAMAMAMAMAADASMYFNRVWVDGQIGRVGYHLTASLQTFENDRPPSCRWQFNSWEFQGPLPPGLTANFDRGTFEGTPRQPGEWNTPLILRAVGCSNTGENYGDRQINLHFRIDP
jgi:hypothetical protein